MRRTRPAMIFLLLLAVAITACTVPAGTQSFAWQVKLDLDQAVPDRQAALQQTIAVIRRRLDLASVSPFKVELEGPASRELVVVRLPSTFGRDRVNQLITEIGRLEFVSVVSPAHPATVQTYATKEQASSSFAAKSDLRRVLPYLEREATAENDAPATRWIAVEVPAIVDGSQLRNVAAVAAEESGVYRILFSLKPEAAAKLESWTGSHINSYLAVVLNDEVKSIAYVKSRLNDQGEVSGRFTKQAAENLSHVLNAGALPVPVKIVSQGPVK